MTRDDLEQLDTRSLRALAKQHLAAQARTLRTRGALLAALSRTLLPPGPAKSPPPGELRAGPGKRAGAAVGQPPTSAAPPRPHGGQAGPSAAPKEKEPLGAGDGALVEEGFFVAHQTPRPQPRRVEKAIPQAGVAPEATEPRLPPGDEAPHLLARDPTTLFLFWDFRRDLERGAAFGLSAPRVLFRLYDGEVLVRTVEAPLGRRSLYLEGLTPGHLYSVEAWLAGSDGHARPTGRRSAALRLAPAAPSAHLEVDMVRVPSEQPLAAWRHDAEASVPPPERERLSAPSRVELPASLEWRGGPGPAGPGSGRP
jgi:hypothetical protein